MTALFVCERCDETRPEDTEFYQSLVLGSELVIFEETSHLPHLPERYAQVLRGFLHRCAA